MDSRPTNSSKWSSRKGCLWRSRQNRTSKPVMNQGSVSINQDNHKICCILQLLFTRLSHKQLGHSPTDFDSSGLNRFTLLQCPEFLASPCFPAMVCNDAVISAQISCPKALKILRLVELAHSAIWAVAFAYVAILCYSIVRIFFTARAISPTLHIPTLSTSVRSL